ncbi:MAG: Na+/H+ antiporter NhaA [Phycisphaerales bacterium]|nr:Na+/H+ antiporter NhaA [Phycisphaerales bacterium]
MAGPLDIPKSDRDLERTAADKLLGPFQRLMKFEAAGGVLLIVCALGAMVWANSGYAASYTKLFYETTVRVGFGEWGLEKAFILWINDLLMAVFFLLVGLEIKREVLVGELKSPKKAALPIAAALGGMAVPGTVYALVNLGEDSIGGWGVPMATDIAFALGVLALVGSRVPVSVRIFLTSLAIVDDLGALLVIAIFYTESIGLDYLGKAGIVLAIMMVLNLMGVRRMVVYLLLGVVVWYLVLKSGVHATIAGVLVAMTIPARTRVDQARYSSFVGSMLERFNQDSKDGAKSWTTARQQSAVLAIEDAGHKVETPVRRLEHALIPWVAFAILPVFALANAGVSLSGGDAEAVEAVAGAGAETSVWASKALWGVVLGLLIGKPVGVFGFAFVAQKLGIGVLPEGANWRHVFGAAWLSAIGFTMALFIANLAFADASDLDAAKLGVLGASVIAGVVGLLILATGGKANTDSAAE